MNDDELVNALEKGTLEPSLFTHEAHVRAAWHCLRQAPFPEALLRFSRALRRFATQQGQASKYHETITVASAALIAERMYETPSLEWEAFAVRHPDLFVRQPSILTSYYTPEMLASQRARTTFVLPDLCRLSFERPEPEASECQDRTRVTVWSRPGERHAPLGGP